MVSTVATLLATWFGCGRAPVGPGTVGTLGALPVWWAVLAVVPAGPRLAVLLGLTAVTTAVGVWASQREADRLNDEDPSSVVIDEAAGMYVALCFLPGGGFLPGTAVAWLPVVVAVVLFRVFDIAKPWPIRRLEHVKPAGVGIMLDDLVAGALAGALTRWVLPLVV